MTNVSLYEIDDTTAILKTKELKNLAIALTNQLNFVKTIELLNARNK